MSPLRNQFCWKAGRQGTAQKSWLHPENLDFRKHIGNERKAGFINLQVCSLQAKIGRYVFQASAPFSRFFIGTKGCSLKNIPSYFC
jgi:hypothetical protein